jgi:hypothetical protein
MGTFLDERIETPGTLLDESASRALASSKNVPVETGPAGHVSSSNVPVEDAR